MPSVRFLVNKRLSDVKLLRFDNRLLDTSDRPLTAVSGRLEGAEDCAERGSALRAGDMAPYRPEIEPLGVVRALLGNKPNCAWGERVELPGEAIDTPDTEAYAESFPVNGGVCTPLSVLENCFETDDSVSSARLSNDFRLCPGLDSVRRPGSACGAARPR